MSGIACFAIARSLPSLDGPDPLHDGRPGRARLARARAYVCPRFLLFLGDLVVLYDVSRGAQLGEGRIGDYLGGNASDRTASRWSDCGSVSSSDLVIRRLIDR